MIPIISLSCYEFYANKVRSDGAGESQRSMLEDDRCSKQFEVGDLPVTDRSAGGINSACECEETSSKTRRRDRRRDGIK
jgi:hypothetical protein